MNPDLINIFLVESKESLNVGSVARAMLNLGFSKLHLVNPENYKKEKAKITACWATDILDSLVIHDSLESSLSGMHEVIGFSGRTGKNRGGQYLLPEWSSTLNSKMGNIALIFGPEDTGLTQDHLSHCKYTVRIPSNQQYPSYNIAQAVLLVLAEISRGNLNNLDSPEIDRPSANDFYQLERIVEDIAKEVGFYGKSTPQPVPYVMRSMLRRLSPDQREMGILLGLFGKIDRKLKRDR